MSTESELAQSSSEAVVGSNASRIEVGLGNYEMSETLADPLSGQDQELGNEQQEPRSESLAQAGDHTMEIIESVNEGLDLGIGTQNVDIETKESDEKFPVDSQEVVTAKGETEPMVDKEEVGPDIVSSHGPNLSDVKSSDLGEDSKPVSSGAIVDNLEDECLGGLKPYESILDDDNASPVTAKVKLSDSDLVWAKVRSHPWWPAQVFDASAATDKANKHFKKGSFLVTYFGDCTFAWNDASRIKPFRQNFSQMAKQSTLLDFLDAIDVALEEVSRRIEFGLACSCISEDVYQKIKTQNIVNPGIREDASTIHGGDKLSSASFFEPAELVEYVKRLASSPNYDAKDELKFVSKRAQLLAFSRWKGYTDLPELETLQGSVESAPKAKTSSPAEEKNSLLEVKVSDPEPKKSKQVYTKRRKTEGRDDCKQDGVFEYEDTTVPKKKEKTLAEFIAEKRLSRRNEKISQENPGIEPHCEKKRKVLHSKLPKSTKKIKANLQTKDSESSPVSPKNDRKNNLSTGDKITPEKARKSFGIGASILKVANQMHSSTPTRVGPCSNSASKMAAKINGSGKSLQEKPKAEALSEKKISPSPDETPFPQSASPATKTPNGKPMDHLQSGEVEQVITDARGSTKILVEDSMLESRDLKDSSKKQQMVHEDMKEAGNIEDEITVKDSNLTGEIITGSDLKEQPSNKNCCDESDSCKEDVSAE